MVGEIGSDAWQGRRIGAVVPPGAYPELGRAIEVRERKRDVGISRVIAGSFGDIDAAPPQDVGGGCGESLGVDAGIVDVPVEEGKSILSVGGKQGKGLVEGWG